MRLIWALTLALPAFAWQPTQADLEAALQVAKRQWGVSFDVKAVEYVPVNACMTSRLYGYIPVHAEQARTDGRVIRVNSNCIGWTPARLENVMLHEYGHILGLPDSDNKRSVMYPVRLRGQKELP